MRFIILGTNDGKDTILKKRDIVFESDDLEESIDHYNKINLERRFDNTWLICDFGLNQQRFFNKPVEYNYENDYLPFLIIGEYDIETDNPDLVIRTDTLIIKSKGFEQEFNDNRLAMDKFLYYLDSRVPAELSISYKFYHKGDYGIKVQKLASTVDIFRKYDSEDSTSKEFNLCKFHMKPLNIENNNKIRNKIPNFVISDMRKNLSVAN